MSTRGFHRVGDRPQALWWVNAATVLPAQIASVPRTFTVPVPAGTTTTADRGPADTIVAGLEPNVIVARSRPTPCSVTCVPALALFGEICVICGQARPAASGVPNPVARSKPGVVRYVPP